jgi:IMP dehydrogenase
MELETIFLGKTYDDFLVRPQQGVIRSRRDIGLTTRLTRRLPLALPVISANMDSVTEAAMAKRMALEGGLGFIHRAMSIAVQAREVAHVKRSHGFVVEQPLCLPKGTTVREARAFMRQHAITGLLIEETPDSHILAGVLSNRDLPWREGCEEQAVDAFMTPVEQLHTRAPGISGEEAERVLFAHRLEKLPLIDAHRRIHGLITKKDLILYRQQPQASTDAKGRLLVGAAIGARGDYLERAAALVGAGVDVILIDIAHGHSQVMQQAVESFRKRFAETPQLVQPYAVCLILLRFSRAIGNLFTIVHTVHPLVNKLLFLGLIKWIARGEKPCTGLGIDTPLRLLFQPVQLCVSERREKVRLRSLLPGTERFFHQRFLLQSSVAVLPGTPER